MSTVDEIQAARKAYNKALREFAVEPFFESFFEKFPHIPAVCMQGYTPSFNDGDPCEHGQVECVSERWVEEIEYDPETWGDIKNSAIRAILEAEYGAPESDDQEIPQSVYPEWGTPEREVFDRLEYEKYGEARELLSGLSDVFESAFGTNWTVNVTRNSDGTVNVDREYYDCGY